MDWSKIIAALEGGADLIEKIAPLAGLAGPVGVTAGAVATGVAEFAKTVAADVAGAEQVAGAQDLATITALTATIAAKNDALAAQIAAS